MDCEARESSVHARESDSLSVHADTHQGSPPCWDSMDCGARESSVHAREPDSLSVHADTHQPGQLTDLSNGVLCVNKNCPDPASGWFMDPSQRTTHYHYAGGDIQYHKSKIHKGQHFMVDWKRRACQKGLARDMS